LLSGRTEPFGQHRLMLHRFELDDVAKAHQPGLAERLLGEKRVELFAGFGAGDQNPAGRRNARPAEEKAALIVIAKRATTPGYRGCPFINYAAEFPDPSHPGHRVAAANKQKMRDRLAALIKALAIRDAARLADAIFLIIDGAYASSQTVGGRNGPARSAAWAANALIDSQLGPPAS
jgi:hypothetical protein